MKKLVSVLLLVFVMCFLSVEMANAASGGQIPYNLIAKVLKGKSVELNWQCNPETKSFLVKRADGSGAFNIISIV